MGLYKYEIDFFTATILEWKFLLLNDKYKDLIVGSLRYLVEKQKIQLFAFAIMNNHMHLLWHVNLPFKREDVQRDFLKFTAQMIIMDLKITQPDLLNEYYVGSKDRKYQIWERNPLTVNIWDEGIIIQKIEYIHQNPVKAGLCTYADEYRYSSASFYSKGIDPFEMLTSCFM